ARGGGGGGPGLGGGAGGRGRPARARVCGPPGGGRRGGGPGPPPPPPASLERARELVTPALERALDRLEPGIREVTDYHFGFDDANGSGGKAVRPALALLSTEAAGAPAQTAPDRAGAVGPLPHLSPPPPHILCPEPDS